MKLVRSMKQYGHISVQNAMYSAGRRWKNPRRVPTNVERMVEGLSRVELEQVLNILQRGGK